MPDSGAYAFQLPAGDIKAAVALTQAVPPDWSWIDGQLDASLQAIVAKRVTQAGWKLDRFRGLQVMTLLPEGESFWRLSAEEGELSLMARREAYLQLLTNTAEPLFVNFYEAGFDEAEWGTLPLESIKQIAISYMQRGYSGDLFFYSNCYNNCGAYNPESCSLHLRPFSQHFPPRGTVSKTYVELVQEMAAAVTDGNFAGARELWEEQFPPKSEYPALIKLEWKGKYGGKKERLISLLDTCRRLKLSELDPATIEYGFSYITRADL